MNRTAWSKQTANTIAYHRAGGRRGYNRQRQSAAFFRRLSAWLLYHRAGMTPAEIAAEMGVHPVTVYRDLWAIGGPIRAAKARNRAAAARAAARYAHLGQGQPGAGEAVEIDYDWAARVLVEPEPEAPEVDAEWLAGVIAKHDF